MPQRNIFTSAILASSLCLGLGAQAGGHGDNPAVDARQGQMQIMSLNIAVLGQMARGNTEYDADAAMAAAANLAAMGQLDQRFFWVPGTDTDTIEGTRALPVIWENADDVIRISGEFGTAAAALAEVAGDGLAPMQAALGPVGAACGACHDTYRQPR